LLKVVGVDRLSGKPRALRVKTDDEQRAWQRAEAKGISPREIIRLVSDTAPGRRPDRKGVVYLLRCGEYYKIGKSVNSERRYRELRIQLPEKPVLIHKIQTNDVGYCEQHWHKRFASLRKNGEWFSLSEEDVIEFTRCKCMVIKIA
jgi:hypothetical protein